MVTLANIYIRIGSTAVEALDCYRRVKLDDILLKVEKKLQQKRNFVFCIVRATNNNI